MPVPGFASPGALALAVFQMCGWFQVSWVDLKHGDNGSFSLKYWSRGHVIWPSLGVWANPDCCRQCGCWLVWSHPRLLPWDFWATWPTLFLFCCGVVAAWLTSLLAAIRTNIGFRFGGEIRGEFESSSVLLERDLAAFWHLFWRGNSRRISRSLASFWSEIWQPFDTLSVGNFAGNFEKLGGTDITPFG